eukprot:TRINITY_DN36484_c0_g1_i1.p1 TRINITY_DN36484_c0_g1~~TRINITY_DN36484_c0_g1_i1.p1  ORF type:complete len:617 (+),score=75.47 TRINITY_DN36484_c0_g1_i1:59-1909(+)
MAELPTQASSLLGRRVKIDGLVSPQGQLLNGQIGTVMTELDVGRLGVRLESGVSKSIHSSKVQEWPLSDEDMTDDMGYFNYQILKTWPAEAAVFYKSQHDKYFSGADPEKVANRIQFQYEYDFGYPEPPFPTLTLFETDISEQTVCSLLRYGLPLDGLLKVMLRRFAGIEAVDMKFDDEAIDESPGPVNVQLLRNLNWFAPEGASEGVSGELNRLLRTVHAVGREAELVSNFDSSDLMRTILAADGVAWETSCETREPDSYHALTPLRMLTAVLFRNGVSVSRFAEKAESKFHHLSCTDWPCRLDTVDGGLCTPVLNTGKFKWRIDKWCAWEQKQFSFMMNIFGSRGLGMPNTVAELITACLIGKAFVADQVTDHNDTNCISQVLQNIEHSEPAAQIDEHIAHTAVQLATDERWARNVESRLNNPDAQAFEEVGDAPPAQHSEQVVLLRIGGNNIEGLRERLLNGPEFRPCREALQEANRNCELPEKALVFVSPSQYDVVRQALVGQELHYFHVVISEDFEYLLIEALQTFPCRQRAKVKQQHRQVLDLGSPEDTGPVDFFQQLVVERTFLCIAPRNRIEPDKVPQSTTEAVGSSSFHYAHYRGLNPRRVTASDSE